MPSEIENLLVILGSAKAGTTSLAAWLSTHEQIVLGREKEPRFFTDFSKRAWAGPGSDSFRKSILTDMISYRENFIGLTPNKWALDASVDYIWNKGSVERIKEFSKNCRVKAIIILRDPVERAISEYNHTLRHGWEKLTFSKSIEAESERLENGHIPLFFHYNRSQVYHDVMRANDIFGDDLLILDYHDLKHPERLAPRICRFLEIDQLPSPALGHKNQSLLPRNMLARLVLKSSRVRHAARKVVPSNLRHSIWKNLHAPSNRLKTATDHEIMEFRKKLRDEIRLCKASALIPTANWTCTRSDLHQTRKTLTSL